MPVIIKTQVKTWVDVEGVRGLKGWLPEQEHIDGSNYMTLSKRDRSLYRLVNDEHKYGMDLNVPFIDELRRLRTDACNAAVRSALFDDVDAKPDKRRKAKATDGDIAPATVTVKIPPCQMHEEQLGEFSMKVQFGIKSQPVRFEITSANIDYICKRLKHDMRNGNKGRSRDLKKDDPEHVGGDDAMHDAASHEDQSA